MEQRFKITVKGGHSCIDKVLSPERVVVFPSYAEGLPVTELGSYVLSGADTEEVYLPPHLSRIGAYAFYNCGRLKAIHAFGRVLDLGAGLFAGDRMTALLDICEFPGEISCLKDMLSEIRQTLRVRLRVLSPDEAGRADISFDNLKAEPDSEARLIFPEYYEESVENTPARQLVYEMHGCGQRYRYSFLNREFKFSEYDSLFPYACAAADENITAELAIGRLRFPRELGSDQKKIYEEYLRDNWKAAASILLEADECESVETTNLEPETLPWLLEEIVHPDEGQIAFITGLAQKLGDTAMVSYCMDLARRNISASDTSGLRGGRRRRRFGLS